MMGLETWGAGGIWERREEEGGYLLGRVESTLSGLLFTVHYQWTQGTRIQISGLSFLKFTHRSLRRSRFRLTL